MRAREVTVAAATLGQRRLAVFFVVFESYCLRA